MANAEAATAPPQGPPTRRAVAAVALRVLLERAGDAILCCFPRSLWVFNATNIAFIAARRVCGEDSRAAIVAKELFLGAFLAMGLLFYFAAPLMLWRLGNEIRKAETRQIGGGRDAKTHAAQRRRPESTGARGQQDGVCGLVTALIAFFLTMVMLVGILIQVLAPAKESCQGRFGSILADIGSFLYSVTFCIIFPEGVPMLS